MNVRDVEEPLLPCPAGGKWRMRDIMGEVTQTFFFPLQLCEGSLAIPFVGELMLQLAANL